MNRLQFITDSTSHAEEACRAGVKWIQVRVKNRPAEETKAIIQKVVSVCRRHNAVCVVNDFLDLALECGADGVHLGKNDLPVEEARMKIGRRRFIVGGTANTIDDVEKLSALNVDYIGLGPFRYTTTKEKLSPILGAEGYREILTELNKRGVKVPPVFAIGGISASDVETLLATGVYGVAVSSVISKVPDKNKIIESFYRKLTMGNHGEK